MPGGALIGSVLVFLLGVVVGIVVMSVVVISGTPMPAPSGVEEQCQDLDVHTVTTPDR